MRVDVGHGDAGAGDGLELGGELPPEVVTVDPAGGDLRQQLAPRSVEAPRLVDERRHLAAGQERAGPPRRPPGGRRHRAPDAGEPRRHRREGGADGEHRRARDDAAVGGGEDRPRDPSVSP